MGDDHTAAERALLAVVEMVDVEAMVDRLGGGFGDGARIAIAAAGVDLGRAVHFRPDEFIAELVELGPDVVDGGHTNGPLRVGELGGGLALFVAAGSLAGDVERENVNIVTPEG